MILAEMPNLYFEYSERDLKGSNTRYLITYLVMAVGVVVLLLFSVSLGSVKVPLNEVVGILTGRITEGTAFAIIMDIRFPRAIAAIVLGGALSVSGFLLQTFFQNPIAGPFVLGISSGAKLFVALFLILMLETGHATSSLGMVLAAFLGAMMATGFVVLISLRVKRMSLLIVCGILIGYICSAITDLCVTFADDSNIVNLHNWSMGSLSGMNWNSVVTMSVIVFLTLFTTFMMSKPISAYQLGEEYARSVGVDINHLRVIIILLSSILSACVTAFAGPISFVGIAVPHIVKSITKTARPIVHLPGCFLGGALITLFSDAVARMLFAPTELSISTVTAVLLVPVVIYMMLKLQGAKYE